MSLIWFGNHKLTFWPYGYYSTIVFETSRRKKKKNFQRLSGILLYSWFQEWLPLNPFLSPLQFELHILV